ncbi:hypothetical protein CDAR_591541 [Caerostris darwini]|uniref:Uncharacterized protein n=1 Tax=Caerostris darwini TaxID=1538125 RepID=A0AAV4PL82_9ARAC|nr:hypothetical protein CDAR_591541 [Caerostris darwini]
MVSVGDLDDELKVFLTATFISQTLYADVVLFFYHMMLTFKFQQDNTLPRVAVNFQGFFSAQQISDVPTARNSLE